MAITNGGSITSFGATLTENFDSLATTGTANAWADNTTIPGWYAQFELQSSSPTTYRADSGGSNTGAIYSWGVAGTNALTERALGSVASGTPGTVFHALKLTNNTGSTVTSLSVSFTGEQWRQGGCTPTPCTPAAQKLDFQYQVANAGTITDANTPNTNWVDHDALDFTSPQPGTSTAATLDGNAAANRTALSSTINVTVNNGQEVWLRWRDVNDANNDHGLAIDDFSVTANGVGPTNPSGTGAASPSSVAAGGTTLLTVAVTPGTNPTSTGLAVSANLTSIGGAAGQPFFDDGSNGDATPNDNIFSYSATVANGTTGGLKNLPATISDAQSRTGSANISLTVVTPTNPSGSGGATPSTVQAGQSTLLTVAVTPGANPTSTGITVTGDLSSIGGLPSQSFFDDGSNGDVTAGDKTFSYNATVSLDTTSGAKSLPVQIADAQSRTGSTSIALSVQDAPVLPGAVVISQIYGGGGNSGATLKNDFIEIFNRSSDPVNLSGWSVQYGSSGGNTWQRTPLTNVILQPGQYYLVQEAAGSGGTDDLPTPNATGTISMSGTAAKIALVRDNVSLNGTTCSQWLADPDLMDFVGYGGANCFEGAGPAPELSNTTAALRARDGCKDTDYNTANFTEGTPAPRNTSSPTNACPVGDPAPEVFSTTPSSGAANIPVASNISINFDEPVNVSGSWFQLSCATSGIHTATFTGGPTNFTLNPDADFVNNEQCTLTVFASQVNDLDLQDPPDNMAANFTLNFRTEFLRDPAEHLVMGNPSNATAGADLTNYLIPKTQYVLSYNCDRGTANWVSWHLDSTWLGSAPRQDDFRADPATPAGCFQVQGNSYSGSGFDRGHMTPSADRTSTIPDNSATFLMTNMVPQAPENNQQTWNNMEQALRNIVTPGNELYIVSGGAGIGGSGDNGFAATIAGGKVTVPAFTWKVALVLPNGDDDINRVDCSTRTIAVIVPNTNGTNPDWTQYLTSVDAVEALTGYDFFSNLPDPVERCVEAGINGVNPGLDTDGDGVADTADNCPNTPPNTQVNAAGCPDADGDGVADADDKCPTVSNPDQLDTDGDGAGNACDADDDNDGQTDADEIACGSNPLVAASKATDTDGDSRPDCVDTDDDNDGVLDGADNCQLTPNADQLDTDNDGVGNTCDADDDNDGVADTVDNCPLTPNADQTDTDGDGIGDTCDSSTKPTNKDQCKNDGWIRFNDPVFKNQGDCIQFVNTGK